MKKKLNLKKWHKVHSIGITALISMAMLTGCNNGNNSSDGTKSKKIPIKIEDIAWSVEEEIVEGEREVVFSYTNNTKYTIGDMEIKFTLKDGITDEELKVFDTCKEEHNIADDKIKDIYFWLFSQICRAKRNGRWVTV